MEEVIGQRAITALLGVQDALGLDYAGIDFAVSPTGEVLLFEANATMVVLPPKRGSQWEYRRAATERAYAAVRAMLARRTGVSAIAQLARMPSPYDTVVRHVP